MHTQQTHADPQTETQLVTQTGAVDAVETVAKEAVADATERESKAGASNASHAAEPTPAPKKPRKRRGKGKKGVRKTGVVSARGRSQDVENESQVHDGQGSYVKGEDSLTSATHPEVGGEGASTGGAAESGIHSLPETNFLRKRFSDKEIDQFGILIELIMARFMVKYAPDMLTKTPPTVMETPVVWNGGPEVPVVMPGDPVEVQVGEVVAAPLNRRMRLIRVGEEVREVWCGLGLPSLVGKNVAYMAGADGSYHLVGSYNRLGERVP